MDNSEIELVGGPCGHHGPYTFYKAFKYSKNGTERIISLCEFFFVKLWSDSDLVCIGELQLLWVDKNSEQMLASLRLYFLPENTPEGRMDHGEDEVLAITEKVVLRLEDLLTWITVDAEWSWGRSAVCARDVTEPEPPPEVPVTSTTASPLTDSPLDFADVDKERVVIDEADVARPTVIVLSYPRYCRYRALMRRLEAVESKWLRHSLIVALGGFASPTRNTRVLFCRDTFDYPDLEGHELLCNHLAPKLKGRPRGKRKKRSISPGGSESNESEASVCAIPTTSKTRLTTAGGRNGLRCNSTTSPRRSTRSSENVEERDFLNKLHAYMKSHRTPIGRIPSIGYKEIDLYAFFTKVQKLGGYDNCTANRMWKPIFDELGGHHNSTSAATIMRRHYERLLLSYERHIKGEEYKPLPVSERRRLKSKTSSFSDAETSEGDRSNSGHTTPVPTTSVPQAATTTTPSTPNEIREFSVPEKTKPEGKTSSLRSVRVKPDRLRDISLQKDKLPPTPTTPPTDKPNPSATSSLPEKNSSNVPVTSAVAPVMEKTLPEKSVSPLEGKENIPVMNQETSVSQTRTEADDEPIEIPYKPKSPEIIDLDPEPEPSSLSITSNTNSTMLYDVKKRKLDILKEGGLEVTAITGYPEPVSRDGRPSVIQHSVPLHSPKGDIGNLSITVTSDSRRMPPPIPVPRSQSPKKAMISNIYGPRPLPGAEVARRPPAVDVRIIGNNKFPPSTQPAKPVVNGSTPPKVMQSRSIYSYSERTVYGNPKDPFMPPPHTPQAPRHLMRSPARPTGGEVLDLTVRSPQKPIVEIMRVPNIPVASRLPPVHSPHQVKDLSVKPYLKNNPSGVPLLDARVGSNLEITLVSGTNSKPPPKQSAPKLTQIPSTNTNSQQRPSQKRSSSGRFVNSVKPMENGNYPPPNPHYLPPPPTNKNGAQLVIPSPHSGGNGRTPDSYPPNKMDHTKHQPHPQQPVGNQFLQSAANPLFPGYISQLAAAAASKNAPFLPMLDPLYYSALCSQGLYSPSAAPHMFPPVPTVDQLQLYKDLMAHSARGRFPFPMPPEGTNPITSIAASDPNLMKK